MKRPSFIMLYAPLLLTALLVPPASLAQAIVEEPRWVPLEPDPMDPPVAPEADQPRWMVAPAPEAAPAPDWNQPPQPQPVQPDWSRPPQPMAPPAPVQPGWNDQPPPAPPPAPVPPGWSSPPPPMAPPAPVQPAWNNPPQPRPMAPPAPVEPGWSGPPRQPMAAVAAIPHVSGGVGASEREELAQVKSSYNLHLLFAVAGSGVYLSDVEVVIQDNAGQVLLSAVSRGPFLYARLAPGGYRLTVTSAGHPQSRQIAIPASGAVSQAFYWSAAQTPGMYYQP